MESLDYEYDDEKGWPQSRFGLVALTLGLIACGLFLYKLAGPPHLPASLPSRDSILTTLKGSDVPLDAVAYILTTIAWILWLWIVASLVFQFLLAVAEVATHGAAWVRNLHVVVDRVTAPLVRRVVDGAVVAAFVVNTAGRITSGASAAPVNPTPIVLVAGAHTDGRPSPIIEAQIEQEQPVTQYTVQRGDSLWAISERFYGTGEEFMRLVDANVGRVMPDGNRFTRAGVIQPGWVLVIPLPSQAVEEVNNERYYVVEKGDTLWGIAARFLGDPLRCTEIFDLNQGVAHPKTGWRLTNPNLIWPGLRLKLPAATETAPSPADPAQVAQKTPVEAAPPVAPRAEPPATVVAPTPPIAPTVALPTSIPTITATPTQVPTVMVAPTPAETSGRELPPLLWGAAAVAVAATGAAAVAVRRFRRSMSEPPVPIDDGAPIGHGFTDADLARVLTHRLQGHEVEPAILVAEQTLRFFSEHGIEGLPLVSAQQSRNAVNLILGAGLTVEARLLELAPELGRRLGGGAEAVPTPDGDVLLRVTAPKLATLLARDASCPDELRLVPIGVIPRQDAFYVNWCEVEHVLVAGVAGSGTEVILTSLLSALAARCRPEELRLWTIASPRLLPPELGKLPHQCGGLIDPSDEARVKQVLAEVQAELTRRMTHAENQGEGHEAVVVDDPELVLVIGELADVEIDDALLDMLAMHGPSHRIRLLAATSGPEMLDDELADHFTTRLVLQMMDEEESVGLLAQPDAVDLASGEMLVRIDGRRPARMRGFRVSGEHLDQIIRLMNEAYGHGVSAAAASPNGTPPSSQTSSNGQEPAPLVSQTYRENGGSEDPLASETEPPAAVSERLPSAPLVADAEATATPNVHARKGSRPVSTQAVVAPSNGSTPNVETASTRGSEAGPPLQIWCFGGFSVCHGDREIEPVGKEGGVYKGWEILAFLACHPPSGVSREKLITSLWPDATAEFQRKRFKSALHRLRELLVLYVPWLSGDIVRNPRSGRCSLDPNLVNSDVHYFQELVHDSQRLPPTEAIPVLERALALYKGDLLAGPDTPRYSWLDDRSESGVTLREQYREEMSRARRRLAKLYREVGQIEPAIAQYRELLRVEPLLEDVVEELYRCYQETGDLTALVKEDRQLRQALREAFRNPDEPDDDLDQYQPSPETEALFEEVRQQLEGKAASRPGNGRRPRGARG